MVDDHGLVRTGVKLILREILNDFQFFEASSKEAAIEALKENSDFTLIILDINIPNYSCEMMIEHCRLKSPYSKIMILSTNSESMMARRYYHLGVDAYVNKSSNDEEIKKAICELLNNKKYFSLDLLMNLANDTFGKGIDSTNPFEQLSHREFEVMLYLFEGKNLQEIAAILCVNASSIGTYKSRIFEKLNVKSIIELYELYSVFNNRKNNFID